MPRPLTVLRLRLGLVLSALAASPALAANNPTDCRVLWSMDTPSRWSGPCVDGLASGDGAYTSAHGTVVIGHLEKGHAVEAEGRNVEQLNNGSWMITTFRESPGKIFLRAPLPKFPGPSIPDIVAAHSVAGTWIRTFDDAAGHCEIRDTIADDGRRTQQVGSASAEDGVTVYGDRRDARLFRVLSTSLTRTGRDACLNPAATGESRVFVVRFDDDAHTQACISVDGSACTVKWRRAESP